MEAPQQIDFDIAWRGGQIHVTPASDEAKEMVCDYEWPPAVLPETDIEEVIFEMFDHEMVCRMHF